MHICIFVLIRMRHAVDNLLRLLSRGGVVQIHKWLSVRALGQNRKIRPRRFNVVGIERRLHERVHVFAFRVPSHAVSRARNASTSSLSSTRSIDSAPNASSNMPLASSSGMPRDCR
jgi:hypothetical protein